MHRKNNESVSKNHSSLKPHLQNMNQTFHSGQKKLNNVNSIPRPSSLEPVA